jgi:putative transposase
MLVGTYAAICTEQLNIIGMTATGGASKTGLNKAILDTSPGFFLHTLRTKAAEAACWYEELNTRKHKPSQTCHACGKREKKRLAERRHECSCGASCSRDENSALVCLQSLTRQELSGCPEPSALAQETPSYAA